MITDPVYEGKSMAGMIDLVSRGEIEKGSNVLYAHLGGQPALSAYAGAVPLMAELRRSCSSGSSEPRPAPSRP